MADWRKLALATILADGKIDDNEIKVLRKELWEDGKIDQDEVDPPDPGSEAARGRDASPLPPLRHARDSRTARTAGRVDLGDSRHLFGHLHHSLPAALPPTDGIRPRGPKRPLTRR